MPPISNSTFRPVPPSTWVDEWNSLNSAIGIPAGEYRNGPELASFPARQTVLQST